MKQFYTAPTAIRSLMRAGDLYVKEHLRDSLRILGSVGEPINPEAWRWYHDIVGDGRCPIVDTWWQTETGGHMITPLPNAWAQKPGARQLYGVLFWSRGMVARLLCRGFVHVSVLAVQACDATNRLEVYNVWCGVRRLGHLPLLWRGACAG